MLTRCNHDLKKFSKVSLHNQSKYFKKETVELENVKIDYEYWGFMAEITKSEVSEEMLWWLSDGNR